MVSILVVSLGFLTVVYLIFKNEINANTNISCPQLMPMAPGWCPNGRIETQPNNSSGCPQPPKCITNNKTSYSYNLEHGWNAIVMPQALFNLTDPISAAPFKQNSLTIMNFSNNKWEVKPTYIRKNGAYLVVNYGQDTSAAVMAEGSVQTGLANSYKLNPGWNLVGNNEQYAKTPDKFTFLTNNTKPNCTTPPLCNESKTIAQLFSEGRIYNRIYFFNNLQSQDPNIFYTAKKLTTADLKSYQIPALKAFWIYLYR